MASSRVVPVKLYPRERASAPNNLVIPFPNVRQAHVYMGRPTGRQRPVAELPWWVSAWAVTTAPQDFGGESTVILAPSRMRIPPLGGFMLVCSVYLPVVPTFKEVGFRFSTEVAEASAVTLAYGYADDTPTDFAGLHLNPVGLGSQPYWS